MTVISSARAMNAFQREAILSASPARLLVMLFDRLMLDLARAEAAQLSESWDVARENLLHAQEIIGELTGSLDLDAWDGAESLFGIYNYASTTLMNANIGRNVALTRECIALLEPLRESWHAAAAAPAMTASTTAAAGTSGHIG